MKFIAAGLIALGIFGYALNIVRFCKADFASPFKEEFFRGVGIVTPFGAVIGYIDFEE